MSKATAVFEYRHRRSDGLAVGVVDDVACGEDTRQAGRSASLGRPSLS
ncbi:hypothetical protein [Streptomyces sp. NPDC048392]